MLIKTPLISYSLKNRGRKHTGQPRNFNIKALFDHINSPACQERVSSRGMMGYYGHMPRIRFGMNPSEATIDSGKYVPVEPAFVTTHLAMSMDGVIEHQAEFASTKSGELAAKLFDSQMGGFSSAIDERAQTFYGFDYVFEPNYLGNSFRGVALDDIYGGNIGSLTYDDIYAAEQDEHAQAMIMLLDSTGTERKLASETIERLTLENEELLSLLAKKGISQPGVLDSAVMPFAFDQSGETRILDDVSSFRSMDRLPGVAEPVEREADALDSRTRSIYSRFMNNFTR